MKPALVMIGGWAHPAEALRPLAEAVAEFAKPCFVAAHEPLPVFDQPRILLGWSLGGLHVLQSMLSAPEQWLGVVLISTTPCFCTAPDWPHGVAPTRVRAMKVGLRKNPEEVLRQFFTNVTAPASPTAVEEKIRAALAFGSDKLAAGLDELLNTDVRRAVVNAAIPALVMHGCEDRIIPCAAGEWLAAQFVYNRFVPLAGAGHDLPLCAVATAAEEIKLFVETLV